MDASRNIAESGMPAEIAANRARTKGEAFGSGQRGLRPEDATLEALLAKGHRIRENPVQPDERVVVFRTDTDLLIHRLEGLDLTTAASVDVVITVEETGDVLLAETNVPFDRESGELLIVCQPHFAALPPTSSPRSTRATRAAPTDGRAIRSPTCTKRARADSCAGLSFRALRAVRR